MSSRFKTVSLCKVYHLKWNAVTYNICHEKFFFSQEYLYWNIFFCISVIAVVWMMASDSSIGAGGGQQMPVQIAVSGLMDTTPDDNLDSSSDHEGKAPHGQANFITHAFLNVILSKHQIYCFKMLIIVCVKSHKYDASSQNCNS